MPSTFDLHQHVGGFVVESKIPTGEFSETWRCRNPISGRLAVLKGLKAELLDDPSPVVQQLDLIKRTRDEVAILTALFDQKYSFVPNIYDVFEVSDGRIFFLTEYIQGQPLGDILVDDTVPMESRAKIAFLLLDALQSIHSLDLVHRDIAPDNVIVKDNFSVVLLDFGLAKIKSDLLVQKYSAQTQTPIGKIKYTPPYCLLKMQSGEFFESSTSWDLYAAGVVLFELFSKSVLSGPVVTIDDTKVAELPCPEAIRALLSHGQPHAQSTASSVKDTLFQELTAKQLAQDIVSESPLEVVGQLKEANARLTEELQAERKPINFETVVRYMTRMGLSFHVNPSGQWAKVESASAAGNITIVVDTQNLEKENTLLFAIPDIRSTKKRATKVLGLVNEINTTLSRGCFWYNSATGEIRYEHGVLLNDRYLGYTDFRRVFAAAFNTGKHMAERFDKEFGRENRGSRTSKAKAQQATSGPLPAPDSKPPKN